VNFNLRDIACALQGTYPEFVTNAVLTRLQALKRHLDQATPIGIALPLPAERGLKNPTADLWVTWLTQMTPERAVPQINLLADDFMRPRLICFASRNTSDAYRLLTGIHDHSQSYDVLASFDSFDEHHRKHAFPEIDRPLGDVIDRFVDALDSKSV
jgi:type VI secretion system protein ImpM